MASEKFDYMVFYSKSLDQQLDELRLEKEKLGDGQTSLESEHRNDMERLNHEITELKMALNDIRKNHKDYKEKVSSQISKQLKTSANVTKTILNHKLSKYTNLPSIIQVLTYSK